MAWKLACADHGAYCDGICAQVADEIAPIELNPLARRHEDGTPDDEELVENSRLGHARTPESMIY